MGNNNIKMANKRIQRERKYTRQIYELLKSDEYFKWLNIFSNHMPIFVDLVDYDITEEEKRKLKQLNTLYEMVRRYAIKNKIKPNFYGNCIYYFIDNLGVNYLLGIAALNHNYVCFCSKCDLDSNTKVIGIDKIREEYNQKKLQNKEELKQLKEIVLNLLIKDISKEDILTSVNGGIEEYNNIKAKEYIKELFKNTD